MVCSVGIACHRKRVICVDEWDENWLDSICDEPQLQAKECARCATPRLFVGLKSTTKLGTSRCSADI
jgi:hypothetical protein